MKFLVGKKNIEGCDYCYTVRNGVLLLHEMNCSQCGEKFMLQPGYSDTN